MFDLRFCATLLVLLMLQLLGNVQAHPPAAATTTPVSAPVATTSYDSKFDNVDLDEILNQERLLNNYIKCLESQGPCTPDAKMLKGKYQAPSQSQHKLCALQTFYPMP